MVGCNLRAATSTGPCGSGGLAAAFGADLGFSPQEYYLFMFPAFLAGMTPCLIEAAGRPEGTLYPLPCEGIEYGGRAYRPWPPAGSE